jgi:hypothetical protein
MARRGKAWQGVASQGEAWWGKAWGVTGSHRGSGPRHPRKARRGMAWHGQVWPGLARQGAARQRHGMEGEWHTPRSESGASTQDEARQG